MSEQCKQSSSLKLEDSESLSACALLVQYQSKFFPELEHSSDKVKREGMKSALVLPWLQVCLFLFEHMSQFSTLELQVALCLLNFSHRHQEFVFSLSDLSRICHVREIRLRTKNQF